MIVLDTHVRVRWLVPAARPLPEATQRLLAQAESAAVSAISCWEVALLHRRGRLELTLPAQEWFEAALQGSGIDCIAIDERIAATAAALTDIHRDPADRFIIATAIQTGRPIVT